MKPQRYHSVDPNDVDRYLVDDGWVAEQKLDGVRCVVTIEGGKASFTSNTGRAIWAAKGWTWWKELVAELSVHLNGTIVLDGELLDETGELWLFDCPVAEGFLDKTSRFEDRRQVLEAFAALLPGVRVHVVPQARTTEAKQALWERVLAGGGEGVCVKDLDGVYRHDGGRTRTVLKVKRTYTCDVFVTAVNVDGKDSSEVAMFRDGVQVPVGKVSMPAAAAPVGSVIEVRFLYVDDLANPRLYQSVFLRRRDDKTPEECEFDQLLNAVPDRAVVAA